MKSCLPLLVTTLAAPPWTLAQESHLRETAEAITLWTDDGLSLTLDRSTGAAVGLKMGDQAFPLPSIPLVRFEEVLELSDAPDLLDGTLLDPGGWNMPLEALEEGWLRVPGPEGQLPQRTVELNQAEAQPLILSGSCRAEMKSTASGWMNAHLALNIYGTYTDGEVMPEQSAYFGQYDHGPQFNRKILCPDKPLSHVKITMTYPGGECRAWYRDVTLRPGQYRISSPHAPCERLDARVMQEFALKEAALRGLLTYQPTRDYLEIRGRLESLEKADRVVSAYVAIPLDAVGGTWHDDFRTARPIEPGKLYRNSKWYGAGRDGYDSRYPLAAIETADGQGLCLATAVDEPRVFQIEYDAAQREFRLRYDLGLSPDAGRWANRGAFTALLFRYEARDGFRGATEKYHRIFDWAFLTKRVDREGLWLAFLTPKSIIGGDEDFHFQFVEAVGNLGWEETQGMVSLQYAEPWIHHHESPAHAKFEETQGPADPAAAIRRAERMAEDHSAEFPLDSRRRMAGYLSSYIEDPWGQPQGYFFRDPQGRNENMMIVNPNANLPPAEGSHFTSGDWDWEIIRETYLLWKQWSLPGWSLYRTGARPCLEVDTQQKASGQHSIRFDPIRSKGYWEQYVRGVSQTLYCPGESAGPFEFSFRARSENKPESGTGLRWHVELMSEKEELDAHTFDLNGTDGEWRLFRYTLETKWRPLAISLVLVNSPWFPDPTVLWIDDVRLTVAGQEDNLLVNGDFEEAQLLPGRLDGVYLDTMECYTNNLNYRRSHWPYAEEPLTFDCARQPALQQQFSHVEYGKRVAEWARLRGLLVFGNCTPGTCFAAPYLDILGGEESWTVGDAWAPKSDADFNFVRFMARAKPFCLLQYSDLDGKDVERYVKRCVFYGVFPGNQSSSRITGKWYWTNPVRVARDRPVYAKFMPLLVEIAQAGWQPLTLAQSDNEHIWLERFGQGERFYLTVFNPTSEPQAGRITLDPRTGLTRQSRLAEMVMEKEVPWRVEGSLSFDVSMAPEEVQVYRIGKDLTGE